MQCSSHFKVYIKVPINFEIPETEGFSPEEMRSFLMDLEDNMIMSRELLADEEKMMAEQMNQVELQTVAPLEQAKAPQAQTKTPQVQANAPKAETHALQAQTNAPQVQTNTPHAQTNTSQAQTNDSQQQKRVSQHQTSARQEPVKQAEKHTIKIPETEKSNSVQSDEVGSVIELGRRKLFELFFGTSDYINTVKTYQLCTLGRSSYKGVILFSMIVQLNELINYCVVVSNYSF